MQALKIGWGELSSEQRKRAKKWGVLTIILLILFCGYYLTGRSHREQIRPVRAHEITSDQDLLEMDIRANVDEQVQMIADTIAQHDQRFDDRFSTQSKKIDALEHLIKAFSDQNQAMGTQFNTKTKPVQAISPESAFPPSPLIDANTNILKPPHEAQMINSIGHISGTPIEKDVPAPKKNTVFLPPSFMKATLLTGIDAMTTELGAGNPETIIFRVQAPAILPNSLKANLKGCFIVANAFGSLAKERVQVRLVSLHCMALSGEAVIDQHIKGFVADKDGKRDMAGIVVTKAGSNLARSFMAGMAGGMGDAVSLSSTTTAISPLGITQVINPEQALQSGLGQGLKSASTQLQQYYLELARQATPVIEVGAAKEVTVVIQEGVELEIKEYSHGI